MTTEERLNSLIENAHTSRLAAHASIGDRGKPTGATFHLSALAIVDQLALGNALTIVAMARQAGEPGA